MNERERNILIEQAITAWRPRDPHGRLRSHHAWHDLDEAGRLQLFDETMVQRTLEAALDSEGLSSTARAVLAKIQGY